MAINGHFKAYISFHGQHLEEYPNDEDEEADDNMLQQREPKCTKTYVQAQEGEEFAIELRTTDGLRLPERANTLACDIFADGTKVYSAIGRPSLPIHMSISGAYSQRGESCIQQNFKFKSVEHTSEHVTKNMAKLKKYGARGTIKAKVWAYSRGEDKHGSDWAAPHEELNIPEKATKGRAVTLGVGYSLPHTVVHKPCATGRRIGTTPLAIFVFEYRTKESLRQLMIIPRTPSPETQISLTERDPDTLTAEETRQALGELRAYKRAEMKRSTSVKRELRDTKPNIKRELATYELDNDGLEIVSSKKSKRNSEVIVLD